MKIDKNKNKKKHHYNYEYEKRIKKLLAKRKQLD